MKRETSGRFFFSFFFEKKTPYIFIFGRTLEMTFEECPKQEMWQFSFTLCNFGSDAKTAGTISFTKHMSAHMVEDEQIRSTRIFAARQNIRTSSIIYPTPHYSTSLYSTQFDLTLLDSARLDPTRRRPESTRLDSTRLDSTLPYPTLPYSTLQYSALL